jgi:hypothetical protein
MTVHQGVVFAHWDIYAKEYRASVGDETIIGLFPIVRRLADNGWRIVSVVNTEWVGGSAGVGLNPNDETWGRTQEMAIFVVKDE